MRTANNKLIDWEITIIPIICIFSMAFFFFIYPQKSNLLLGQIRLVLGDTFGAYYLLIGLGVFLISLYLAFSSYGNIVLGNKSENPRYSFWTWGAMMFTCGLAADILFYSFSEWVMYASDPHITELGTIQNWAGVFLCFIGDLYHGLSIWCWLLPSDLCCMSGKEIDRSFPRHVDQF